MVSTINRKKRRWGIGIALGLTVLLVWWLSVFVPLEDQMNEISANIEKESLELHHLKKELKKISSAINTYKGKKGNFERFSHVFTGEKTLEETNATVQAGFQKFLENHHISLIAYKELPPGKWREYAVGRLEFQLSASIESLSEVLRFLETERGATRIERIVISYRSPRNESLHVLLRVGTLFVNKPNWN
jgi:hypothetical protein